MRLPLACVIRVHGVGCWGSVIVSHCFQILLEMRSLLGWESCCTGNPTGLSSNDLQTKETLY
jgi:hypothetical protein